MNSARGWSPRSRDSRNSLATGAQVSSPPPSTYLIPWVKKSKFRVLPADFPYSQEKRLKSIRKGKPQPTGPVPGHVPNLALDRLMFNLIVFIYDQGNRHFS